MHSILAIQLCHIWATTRAQPLLGLTVTLGVWEMSCLIDIRARHAALSNPTVLSIIILVALLLVTHTSYKVYFAGAAYIHFLLGPATVALAVPMYDNWRVIRLNLLAVIVSLTSGSIAAAGSAMLIARALGAPKAVVISLGPKSVTMPIALGLSQSLGGQPSLTAAFVMITGILGMLMMTGVFRLARVRDWRAQGLAAGMAAHGLGTSRMLVLDPTAGAFGGVAIGLNGILTSVMLPILVTILGT